MIDKIVIYYSKNIKQRNHEKSSIYDEHAADTWIV